MLRMPDSGCTTTRMSERDTPSTWLKSLNTSKPGCLYTRMAAAMGEPEYSQV